MRVVLYYDLLRFSPCSIDLFRNEHFSPQPIYKQYKAKQQPNNKAAKLIKVVYFRIRGGERRKSKLVMSWGCLLAKVFVDLVMFVYKNS